MMKKPPTRKEIEQLPRWARVAFAARCARRVLPLYKHYCPEVAEYDIKSVTGAAAVAERSAALAADATAEIVNTTNTHEFEDAADAADWAETAADYGIGVSMNPTASGSYEAGNAAAFAAHAASQAARQSAANAGAYAASRTVAHAARAGEGFSLAPFIRGNYETLVNCAKAQAWTAATAVAPEVFGPLWPDGPPEGWPEETQQPAQAAVPGKSPTRRKPSPTKRTPTRRNS
jgi:hypothetical protein